MRFSIFGGGCYGTFYARQLLRAREAGALPVDRITVVDHGARPRARRELPADPDLVFARADWDDFLDARLAEPDAPGDERLVTPPFTPHLALAWLLRRAREDFPGLDWRLEPFHRFPGTPFERQDDGGPLVVSHADWVCPVHCIEPDTCPKTRGPRFWDLDRTTRDLAVALEDGGQPVHGIHLFHCHHHAFGVGAYPAAEVVGAREAIATQVERRRSHAPTRFLVGTISHCHGALHLLACDAGTIREAGAAVTPAEATNAQP